MWKLISFYFNRYFNNTKDNIKDEINIVDKDKTDTYGFDENLSIYDYPGKPVSVFSLNCNKNM